MPATLRDAVAPAHPESQCQRTLAEFDLINYNLGKDLVLQFVESRSGVRPASRWNAFASLLASQRSPSDQQ